MVKSFLSVCRAEVCLFIYYFTDSSSVKVCVRYRQCWSVPVLTHMYTISLITQGMLPYFCAPHSTWISCCRWSMSARGIMEGLPWAHWKGSWQEDKALMSWQLSSKVKLSLNLIAPGIRENSWKCCQRECKPPPAAAWGSAIRSLNRFTLSKSDRW